MERTSLSTTVLVVLVFTGLLAGATTAGTANQAADSLDAESPQSVTAAEGQPATDRPTIVATTEYRLTPTDPGRVEVQWEFDIPDSVVALNTSVVNGAQNVRADGFARVADGTYRWDEDEQPTRTPTLTFTVPVNRTREVTGPEAAGGTYTFVDAGDWALFQRQIPRNVAYSYRSSTGEPTVERRSETAGPGVVGTAMVFLGPHETTERSAHGQTFQLVVPDAATLAEERADVFASVTAASDRLRVGDRDERVLMIAAPQEVPWAIRGLQTGDRDFYVVANETVDSADNVWLHEYVHTRQGFETTDGAEWVIEASAEYYAGLLTLEQGRIDFQTFRNYLERGTYSEFDDVRLTAPNTWRANAGDYVKGALVAGALDRRIREATDGSASLQGVVERMNRQETVSHAEFVRFVEDAGGASVRDLARRYTETTATPGLWTQRTHQQVFGSVPAAFSFQFPEVGSEGLRISGPYGERPYTGGGIVRGESLTAAVTVTNVGGTDGAYELVVTRDGDRIATHSGRLGVGASTTHPVTATFAETGQYRLSTGDDSLSIRVLDLAPLSVTDLTASRTAPDSDEVRVTATVENRYDRPGEGTVAISRGPTELTRQRLQLASGERTTLNATTTLDGPGTYEFAAGNATLTLTVEQSTGGDESGGSATGGATPGASGPGFGLLAGVVACLCALLLANRVE